MLVILCVRYLYIHSARLKNETTYRIEEITTIIIRCTPKERKEGRDFSEYSDIPSRLWSLTQIKIKLDPSKWANIIDISQQHQ